MANSLSDAALVFLLGTGACLALGRLAVPWLTTQGAPPTRYNDCPPLQAYQQTKRNVPTMGGLFVLAAASAAALVGGGLESAAGWVVLASAAALGAVGLWDDRLKFAGMNARGLRTWPKLVAAMGVGAGVGVAMLYGPAGQRTLEVPLVGRDVDLGWAWVPFAMLVVAGSSHAVNLTDGMDGLAAGCLAAAFAGLGVMATSRGDGALVAWCAALAGACVGFLWFNSFPASVFLGDVGALGLGAALAVTSLLSGSALWLVAVGGIFVVEALSVMLQVASYKWRGKRRIFRVAPIHHHFHLSGITEPKLIVRFWIVGVALAAFGLAAGSR
jgi:phospho-N-acetylmuramoyl-pentapeptide-transferase